MFLPAWTTVSSPAAVGCSSELEVDVWSIDLDAAPDDFADLLDDDERARAKRFAAPVHSRRFIAAHGYLRVVLSAYLGCAPGAVTFQYGARGKPALREPAGDGLVFNLAHSRGQALITVGRTEALGIDIEVMRPVADWRDIATRTFAPGEVDALLSLPRNKQMDGFFACWTRKEAIIKFWGEGLSADLASFEVNLNPLAGAHLTRIERPGQDVSEIQLYGFKTDPSTWAALAAPGNSADPRFWLLR